jgi:hypothetical protein
MGFTPKGLDLKAQGKRSAALGGEDIKGIHTPKGLHQWAHATLMKPLRGKYTYRHFVPRAALRLPWALRSNPFGVNAESAVISPLILST